MPGPCFKRSAQIAVVLLAICLSGCYRIGGHGKSSIAFVKTCYVLCDETVINAENRVEYVKVTGALTFDGAPVVYDEVIRLSYTTGTYRDGRQPPPMSGPMLNRDRIVKRVGQGALALDVLIPAKNETVTWDGSAASPAEEARPERLRLQFRWIDDATTPHVLERYESISYFQRSDARIKVIEPLRFSRGEPTPEIENRSAEQATNTLVSTDLWARFSRRVVLYPVPKEVWSQIPEVVAVVSARAQGEQPLLIDGLLAGRIERATEPNPRRVENTMPLSCNTLGTRCTPRDGARGYSTSYPEDTGHRGKVPADFGRGIVWMAIGEAAYDPRTETVYLAPLSWLPWSG